MSTSPRKIKGAAAKGLNIEKLNATIDKKDMKRESQESEKKAAQGRTSPDPPQKEVPRLNLHAAGGLGGGRGSGANVSRSPSLDRPSSNREISQA